MNDLPIVRQHASLWLAGWLLAGLVLSTPPRPAQAAVSPSAAVASSSGKPITVQGASVPRNPRAPIGCLIGPERVADVGSPVVGVVAEMRVDSGDVVAAGQPLVLLRHDVESAGVQAAEERARIDADIRAAETNLQLARQRHTRTVQLRDQGFMSSQASDQTLAEQDVAKQKLEQARSQKRVSARDLGVMRAQLEQRTVRSPFAGVVVERFINAGERVEEKPLLRVAMLNPLRVELVMPASRYGSVATGDSMNVVPDLAGTKPIAARVTHVDRVIDAASNTFRVRLKLPNPGQRLPAGARCKIEMPADAAAAAVAPATRPAPAVTPVPSAAAARIDGVHLALRLSR